MEDAHCLAVAKPAGLLTQAAEGTEPALEAIVRRHLAPEAPGSVYLGTVHRLDRPVSGVVLWAKTSKAARRLAAQFAERSVQKEYWALVEGTRTDFPIDEVWDDWLTSPDRTGVARSVTAATPGARHATTHVRYEQSGPSGAWLRLWPETGRTHQLRAQAAARGHAILGDVTYGATRPFPVGIALHARMLEFRHPVLRNHVRVEAPLPEHWPRSDFGLPGDALRGD